MQPTLASDKMYNIVPDTGLQFLDFDFASESAESFRRSFLERDDEGTISLLALRKALKGGRLETTNGEAVDPETSFSVKFPDALSVFRDCWLPMPFLKVHGGEGGISVFEKGPTNWVRFRITPLPALDGGGADHRLTIVVDTATARRNELSSYVMPLRDDVENEAVFGFASDVGENAWLLNEDWLEKWLSQGVERAPDDIRLPKSGREIRATAGWAMFITLLAGLREAGICPELKLVDTVSESTRRRAIDVDLVLDIGNSRTCGVLIEKRDNESGRLDLKNTQTLLLRDLTDPVRTYEEPFQSDVEFRRAIFGDDRLSRLSGRPKAFSWQSLVRVGPEAVRLNAARYGSEGASGLSAPKRYLWDEATAVRPWYFNNALHDVELSPMTVVGELRKHLSTAGDALSECPSGTSAAMEPLFSRSSLFSLMLVEVVLQAYSQINSIAHRSQFQPESSPRRLARVIITIPTGTPLVERQLFEKRARHARSLLLELLKHSPAVERHDDRSPLEFSVRMDEATCTQITYLYGLIADRFKKHGAKRVFEIIGKPGKASALRIASLDIGGGTTDLMISDFDIDEASVRIRPRQIFREGFRRAGDDLLHAIIAYEVLPAIASSVEAAGVKSGNRLIAEWMRRSGSNDVTRQNRKLFTGQVLRRLGLAVLGAHENQGFQDDYATRSREIFTIDVPATLEEVDMGLLESFEIAVAESGGAGFKLREVEVGSSGARIESVITSEMGGMLHNLCRMVNELDSDVLLISGRPSRLPAMREVVRRQLPVSPHRVVAMHGHRVGPWNPFARGLGYIEDPKTTVVVGALIASLGSEGGLEEFDIDLEGVDVHMSARIIGRMEGKFVRENAILFDDTKDPDADESPVMTWSNTTFLGFRQIASERWPATPLYRLRPKPNISQRALATRPWNIVIARDEAGESIEPDRPKARAEILRVSSIEQAGRDQMTLSCDTLELRLQTMSDDDYWLDTGFIDFQGDVALHGNE